MLRQLHRLEVLGLGQTQQLATDALVAIFDRVDGFGGQAAGFGRRRRKGQQCGLLPVHGLELMGDADVPGVDHLRMSLLAVGDTRMTGDEGQLAHAHPFGAEGQESRGMIGLAVLIDPEQREIQVVAGVSVVVRVATKGRDLQLWRRGQAHIRELAVAVEPVLAALVEGHGLAGEAGAGLLSLAQLCQRGAPGREGILVSRSLGDGGIHLGGDVFAGHQHHELQAWYLDLLSTAGGSEAVPHQIRLGAGDLGDAAPTHMMVRHHQPVPTHEGARAPREAHRSQLQLLQPSSLKLHAVLGLDLLYGHIVEGPHPLVRAQRRQG